MHVTSGNPSQTARRLTERTGAKPAAVAKPPELASFMPEEKQALRKILDTPLPRESEVLGRCLADKEEIKTYKRESGYQRVDIKRKGERDEECLRTFSAVDAEPGMPAPRGRVLAVESRKQGVSGAEEQAPAVHTFHYANGLKQTVAESERGEIFWLAMRQGEPGMPRP